MSSRKTMMNRVILVALLLVFTACTVLAFSGMGARSRWVGLPASGEMSVIVRFPDGRPAGGAFLSAGRKALRTGKNGALNVAGVPAAPGVVSAEIVRGEGGFLGMFKTDVRYAAFQQIDPKVGEPLKVELKLSAVSNIDTVCRSCHPDKAGAANPHIRCAHKSGIPLKQAQVDRVRAFNRENEALKKAGKPAMPPIVLAVNTVNPGFFKEKRTVLVCLSCHTNHVDTGIRKYVLMPFDDPSTLCRGCHV